MSLDVVAKLMVFAPLVGSAVVGLNSARISDRVAQIITCTLAVLSSILAWCIFTSLNQGEPSIHITLLRWFTILGMQANWAIYIDMLTATMLIVVTTVSCLVHIYSVGYMSHDPHKPRFMAYLSLFTFCMIMLVCADNFIQLFFGWEGVGVCSYLLIGFWFHKGSANAAAIKAFLVNRVGDIGLALGIFLIALVFGSVEYQDVFAQAQVAPLQLINFFGVDVDVITMACLLLFLGAMGKSAQLGLHTWLPDAMEGPTPVSALIHAATMVTAGVFLVARCSPLFEHSVVALNVVTVVGAATCLFAATIALTQNDIKKIIAYSTCSQLGYMFFACGVSAYSAGIFHLMTHGFFKALLFLGAGSVIHAMSNEQDIRKMGGIWRLIPVTYTFMWIGSLALGGIFPFAGYYSKDIILEAAFASSSQFGGFAFLMGLMAAALTAFYSWRLLILTFHGKANASKSNLAHVHESPFVMLLPLFVLSIGALLAGYIGANVWGMVDEDGAFWRGAITVLNHNNSLEAAHHIGQGVALLPLVAGAIGIAIAYLLYTCLTKSAAKIAKKYQGIYCFLLNKWYFDELYERVLVSPMKRVGTFFSRVIDARIIDGVPNNAAYLSGRFAAILGFFQTGFVYHYAFIMLLGLLLMLTWAVF